MIPGYKLNKVADDIQKKKNTFAPYLTKFTPKALQPVKDVRNGVYGGLEMRGRAIPADFANQRAGDPNYTETQLRQVMGYINNPANGWIRHSRGVYKNHTTGGVYDSNKARSSAFEPVRYFNGTNVVPSYNPRTREARIPSQRSNKLPEDPMDLKIADQKYIDVYNQKASDTIHPMSSSYSEMAVKPMTRYQVINYSPAASASHEFNHGYTANNVITGLIRPFSSIPGSKEYYATDDPMDYLMDESYAKSVAELINSASLFQQQHFRNMGRRIVDKNKFWDDINNAKKNIQDYDPESRRFLQSLDILQNEAPNDPGSAYMLNQLQEAMPLISQNKQLPGYNTNYKHNMIG